jgi:hypothetical protein
VTFHFLRIQMAIASGAGQHNAAGRDAHAPLFPIAIPGFQAVRSQAGFTLGNHNLGERWPDVVDQPPTLYAVWAAARCHNRHFTWLA